MPTDLYTIKLKEFKKLAKRADQRLVRLERLSNTKGYEGVTEYAYRRAMKDISGFGGKNRFNIKPPDTGTPQGNIKALQGRINAISRFLESETSTKKGVIKTYKERAKNLNNYIENETGVNPNITWLELANFYEHGKDIIGNNFNYQEMYQAVVELKRKQVKNQIDQGQKIKDFNEDFVTAKSDKVQQHIIKKLDKLGIKWSDVF